MKYSLFFFGQSSAATGRGAYDLLLDCARLADEGGLTAVWTPERHFADFGGPYPNPSVTAAALAVATRRLRLRAGSVILPLQDPLRVAEEWAVVDNLSGGRAEISFGSGWNVNDFVLAPDRYERRREVMLEEIEVVRALWRGETVARCNGAGHRVEVGTLPRPVQRELPVWLTAQSEGTFEAAGRAGHGLLTNLNLTTMRKLERCIGVYRSALRGPSAGVTLMVHAFVGASDADARAECGPALRRYLCSNLDLRSAFAAGRSGGPADGAVSEAERDALVEMGLQGLLRQTALIGSIETCRCRAETFAAAGVDELACLIDFGADRSATLDSVGRLRELAACEG